MHAAFVLLVLILTYLGMAAGRVAWLRVDRTGIALLAVIALLASGELVQILPDWAEERFPLYAYHPSRHLPPAKVRAFLNFVLASVASSALDRAG